MGVADLPNSDPSVTPDWKPLPFPRIPFFEAAKTSRIDGEDECRYAGVVPPDWCGNGGRTLAAHGGFCVAVMISTAQRHVQSEHGENLFQDPISASVEFLEPLPPGPYHIVLKTRQAGNTQATVHAEMVSADKDEKKVYSIATIRLGNLKHREGQKSIQPAVGALPDRAKDCERWGSGLFYYFNPPASVVRNLTPNDGPNPFWSKKFGGQQSRDQWVKLDDGNNLQWEHLPVISDLVPALTLNFEENPLETSFKYKIPTLSFYIQFCERFEGQEWLLMRSKLNRLHGMSFGQQTLIINDRSEVVAICNQTCAMIPKSKTNKKKKTQEKL